MKRIIALMMIAVMILALAGCSGSNKTGDNKTVNEQKDTEQKDTDKEKNEDKKKDEDNTGDKSEDKKQESERENKTDLYPRVTYYDNDPEMKWAASVQNSHLQYTYGENWDDDEGTVPLPYEFLNCADYHYHCGYTLCGYEDARKEKLAEPDDHIAIVIEDGKGTLYDFYRKLIIDDYPIPDNDEERAFKPICPDDLLFCVYRSTIDYEKDSKSVTNGEMICERAEKSVNTSLCPDPKGYLLKTKIIEHGKKDYVSEYTEYDFVYDADTEVSLHADIWVVDYPKANIDESTGEIYNTVTSYLSKVLDVTTYELNCVKPDDVKNKIAEVMSGHESEYKHISFSEYNEIFE